MYSVRRTRTARTSIMSQPKVRRTHSEQVRARLLKPCADPTKVRYPDTGYCRKISGRPVKRKSTIKSPSRHVSKSGRKHHHHHHISKRRRLAACLKDKKRLQTSVFRLAAKLVVAGQKLSKIKKRKSSRSKKKSSKGKGKVGNPQPRKSISNNAVVALRRKSGSRRRSKTPNTAAGRKAKEARINAKKQARLGKEDDYFTMLAKKYATGPISDAAIQEVLRLADDTQAALPPRARSPARPVVAKRRIAPTPL